jgi:hypothetical protein
MNLLSFAAKESSKERPLLARRSASQKKPLRCYPSARLSSMALVFCPVGGLLSGFLFRIRFPFLLGCIKRVFGQKKAPSWAGLKNSN